MVSTGQIGIKNERDEDITGNYNLDAIGAALRFTDATQATIGGKLIDGGASLRIYQRDLDLGQTDERTINASRSGANGTCRFSQLKFAIVCRDPLPGGVAVVADLASRAEVGSSAGYTNGIDPDSFPDGSAAVHVFSYDISGAGISGNAAGLELEATSTNGAALTSGGTYGLAVAGGNGGNAWDNGEGLSFKVRIRDSHDIDITRFFWVNLTGATVRWNDTASATIAGTAVSGNGSAIAYDKNDLPTGQTGQTAFTAVRSGASTNCQFAQLRFRIAPIPKDPTTLVQYSKAAATGAPPAGWAFYWNAPTNWAPGVEGDLASGAVTARNSWRPLKWSGTQWTADGDNASNNSPYSNLRLDSTGGHPGDAGTTRALDRCAIAAFTIGQAGDYRLLLGKVTATASGGGVRLKVFRNNVVEEEIVLPANDEAEFSHMFNNLVENDEIAVAVGGNGGNLTEFLLDYQIALLKPKYTNAVVINVDDYGAVGNGVADDGPEVRSAIRAWSDFAGPCVLSFSTNKTYKLGDNTIGDAYFILHDRRHKVVEGNGPSCFSRLGSIIEVSA